MANKSFNEIQGSSDNWAYDERNGLPYSGKSIREFQQKKNLQVDRNTENKFGAVYFDRETMTDYYFASVDKMEEWKDTRDPSLYVSANKFDFSSIVRNMKVTTSQPTTQWYTTLSKKAEITVGFISQEKEITAASWNEVIEPAIITVLVDSGNTGKWTTIEEKRVENGKTLTVDVRKYLLNGSNQVRFVAKGEISEEVGSLIFSVNVTTMYLTPSNFNWVTPFVEGNNYSLGGVLIGGAISKKLLIKVSGNGYEQIYEDKVGTNTATTNAYFFNGMEFPTAGTGVYHIEMWLDADTVESEHLHYDIMCIAEADLATAQLAIINDVNANLKNYSDGEILKYACYNGGAATATPMVEVKVGNITLLSETLADVPTSNAQSLASSIEVDSDASDLEVDASVTFGNTATTTIALDNSASYPAKQEASFYMNAATRSNAQENKTSIINEVDGSVVATEWTNIDFVDGVDGHTVDDTGRKCLRIPANGKVSIATQPLSAVTNKTIEIAFKVANAANYTDDIITIATDKGDSFVGMKVKPTNVAMFSNLKRDAIRQSYNLKDGEVVHLIISLTKNYRTNFGNLAKIYVNGEVRCEFDYDSTDSWVSNANIILGSATADLYVYKMRVYESGCEWYDAVSNFVNCLPTIDEKKSVYNKVMSIIDDSYNIDFNEVEKAGYNYMVVEMLDGASLPDYSNTAGGNCNLTIKINNIVDGEIDNELRELFSGKTLYNQPVEGQGTTAMTYYRWNTRSKLTSEYGKRRITFKKNVASSMQSHKMGATRAYNDLHRAVVGANEANARVTLAQYPVYRFEKVLNEKGSYSYFFAGIGTLGADKGDKVTFGYDNETYKDSLISLEGSDHSPLTIGFDYPWSATRYSSANEAMGAITPTGVAKGWEVGEAGGFETDSEADQTNVQNLLNAEFKPAYDFVYNCAPFIEGVTETLEQINADADAWKNTHTTKEFYTDGVYDLYYYDEKEKKYKANGINLLAQFPSADVTSLSLEEKTSLFIQLRKDEFKANIRNYWHLEDALFCYAFLLIFGATDNFKKNSYPYKFARLVDGGVWRWRQDDLDTLFDINNQGAATKAYSILVGDIESGESIFKGDDSVFWTLLREVFAEPDEDDPTLPSVKSMVRRIFDAMYDKCPASYGSNRMARLVGYIRATFWDPAQYYYPQSAYNEDAVWTYEDAWGLYGKEYNNSVHPLSQSLGGHTEAERRWVELRMIFIASMFGYADFGVGNSSEKSLGQINYRAAGDGITYSIEPAIDMNPTILAGDSDIFSAGARVIAGEVVDIDFPSLGSTDTSVYIQGADYIRQLGDLSKLQLKYDASTLSVGSARLQSLKVGDEVADNVTSNLSKLTLGDCPSLERVDARNLASLGDSVSLMGCPRIKEALFEGTSINKLDIPEGSKIESVSLPATLQHLSLVKVNRVALSYPSLANVSYLRLENNEGIDGFATLKSAFSAGNALQNIRIVGFDHNGEASDIVMLSTLADGNYYGIRADGEPDSTILPVIEGVLHITDPVNGEDYDKVVAAFPSLTLDAPNIVNYIKFANPVVQEICATNWGDGAGITKEQAAAVTSLGRKFSENSAITTFNELKDFTKVTTLMLREFKGCSALETIDLTNIEIANDEAMANCTSLAIPLNLPNLKSAEYSSFSNTPITAFIAPNIETIGDGTSNAGVCRDCKNLTTIDLSNKVAKIGIGAFKNCTALEKITIPASVEVIGQYSFQNCAAINEIIFSDNEKIKEIRSDAFNGCTSLTQDIILPNAEIIEGGAFMSTNVRRFLDLGKITTTGSGGIYQSITGFNQNMELIILPPTTTTIANNSFSNCGSFIMVCKATTPPSLGSGGTAPQKIYVPDPDGTGDIVEKYKAATNWSTYASRIFPISQLQTDDPTLYAEIEEYL